MDPIAATTKATNMVVVVIDDEVQLRRLLRISLESHGYTVYEAANGRDAGAEVVSRRPDAVLLDLGLPDMDGFEVLLRLREWTNVPILVLSVRNSEQDKIRALRSGADDYITKPFSVGELLARLEVARRHTRVRPMASAFQSGPLEVDLASRQVKLRGKPVKLTSTEYALLLLLIQNAGKVLTHPQILAAVWGPNNVDKAHYLHVYVTHLRDKLEVNSKRPKLIVTVPRIGYKLNASPFGAPD